MAEEKLVPKLRFNGFNENWNEDKFENIFDIKNGLNKGKDYFGKGIQILNYMDVNNYELNTENTIKGLVELNDEEIKRYSVKPNDLFFTRTSETSEEIGLTSAYVGKEIKCVFSGFLLRARPKMDVNSLFFAYYFRSPKQRNNIIKFSSITTRALISGGNLSKMKIKFPNIGEQNKITKLFLILNKKIELLEKKYQYYQDFKKYLMQQIFTQKLRFAKFDYEWLEYHLKDTGKIITGTTPSTKNKDNFSDNGYLWVTPGDISNKRIVTSTERNLSKEGLNNGRELPPNSILVTCIGATIGKICMIKEVGSCNQQLNAIIPNEQFDPDFIYYTIQYNAERLKLIAGNTATPILNKKSFGNIKFEFPNLKEQQRISGLLTSMDDAIDNIESGINNMQYFKKGLLQQMFI